MWWFWLIIMINMNTPMKIRCVSILDLFRRTFLSSSTNRIRSKSSFLESVKMISCLVDWLIWHQYKVVAKFFFVCFTVDQSCLWEVLFWKYQVRPWKQMPIPQGKKWVELRFCYLSSQSNTNKYYSKSFRLNVSKKAFNNLTSSSSFGSSKKSTTTSFISTLEFTQNQRKQNKTMETQINGSNLQLKLLAVGLDLLLSEMIRQLFGKRK